MKQHFFVTILLCLACGFSYAQSVNDELELQAFARRFMAAYNEKDPVALRKMYTDDAVRIDQQGNQIKGSANIADYFAEQFRLNSTTLLIRQTDIYWSDNQQAWTTRGKYEIYGKTIIYDIPVDLAGNYNNAMQKINGEWKIARSVLTQIDLSTIKADIQALNNTWANAYNSKDVDTILALYAEDAISMPDGGPMIAGKAAIRNDLETSFANRKTVTLMTIETLEVLGTENMVTETGKVTVRNAVGEIIYTEKYMQVWEKFKDKWLIIREIYNHDSK